MPRWTYGPATSGVPLGPTVPTTAPSATVAPFFTASEPRWVSVTSSPPGVWIVSEIPFVGTVPANDTVPLAGATTGTPLADAPMSTPRCWPAAYGYAGSKEKPCRTGPATGHVHARAAAGTHSRISSTSGTSRRIPGHRLLCCLMSKRAEQTNSGAGRCQIRLQRAAVERVPRDAGEAGDELGRPAAREACRDELGHRGERLALVGGSCLPRAEDERDLALRRLGEALGDLRGRPADDLLEALRQLAADGDRALRRGGRQRPQRPRQALRRLERDRRPRPGRELVPQGRERLLAAREEAEEAVLLGREARRDERRLDRRRPGEHRHGHAGVERRPHEPRARVGHAGQARVRHERHALARPETRQELRRPLRFVV